MVLTFIIAIRRLFDFLTGTSCTHELGLVTVEILLKLLGCRCLMLQGLLCRTVICGDEADMELPSHMPPGINSKGLNLFDVDKLYE